MIRIFTLLSILTALLFSVGCSKESSELTAEEQAKADAMETQADSLHEGFTGIHTHLNTSGSLSQHAHQNLPKKRRLAKKRIAIADKRRAAYEQAKARQQERIAKHKKLQELKAQEKQAKE